MIDIDSDSKFDKPADSGVTFDLSIKNVQVADVDMALGAAQWLSDHMRMLETQIIREAYKLAEADGRKIVAPVDISKASELFAASERRIPRELGFKSKMLQSISGITVIAGALAIIFGLLAVAGTKELSQGAWDIAKIFAGAVVGSTGAAAVQRRK
jgi:hypothetical protein